MKGELFLRGKNEIAAVITGFAEAIKIIIEFVAYLM